MSRNCLKFLVHWKGYTAEHDEWIDKGYLEHSQGLIDEYNQRASIQPRVNNGDNVTLTFYDF